MEDNNDADDTLIVAQKSWARLVNAASNTGYREGVEEGSAAILQENFDVGYEDGFRAAFELGKYKGLATIFFKDHDFPADITKILEKTSRGACHICIAESRQSSENDESNLSSADILAEHKKHVESTLKTLREYFELLMKDRGINVGQSTSE